MLRPAESSAPRGSMLDAAAVLVDEERLANVALVEDDLFASTLEPASFDLVHARFELAPLGRFTDQLAAYRRLVKPGGFVVLEEPDISSWRFNPDAPWAATGGAHRAGLRDWRRRFERWATIAGAAGRRHGDRRRGARAGAG